MFWIAPSLMFWHIVSHTEDAEESQCRTNLREKITPRIQYLTSRHWAMLTRILRYYYYSGSTSQHHTYGLGIFIRRDIESIKISVKNVAPHSPINKKNRKLLQLKHSAANHSKKKNTTVIMTILMQKLIKDLALIIWV